MIQLAMVLAAVLGAAAALALARTGRPGAPFWIASSIASIAPSSRRRVWVA